MPSAVPAGVSTVAVTCVSPSLRAVARTSVVVAPSAGTDTVPPSAGRGTSRRSRLDGTSDSRTRTRCCSLLVTVTGNRPCALDSVTDPTSGTDTAPPAADRKQKIPGPGPLRNPGWLLTNFFDGVFWTNQVLLNTVIPLWLVEKTDAPRVLLAFLFGTNTVMCIFLPMVAARGVDGIPTALRAVRVSTLFFVFSCLITLATHDTVGWVTIALVWLGHVTVTGAELYLSAANWTFEAELMDPRQRGAYQGAANLSGTLGKVWAPAVYTFLAMNWGAAGWLVIAGIVVTAAIGIHPSTRLARRFLETHVPAEVLADARASSAEPGESGQVGPPSLVATDKPA